MISGAACVLGLGACIAFGGDRSSTNAVTSDAASVDDATVAAQDGGAIDAGQSVTTEAGASDASTNDASDDACVTTVYPAVADTYTNDAGCNSNISRGNAQSLVVGGPAPSMIAYVRFSIGDAGVIAMSDSDTRATFWLENASCAGQCIGALSPMRSDWDEGTGGGDGADYCRSQGATSTGWGAGATGTPIASGVDYGGALASMTISGAKFESAEFPTAGATPWIAQGAVSFLVQMTGTGAVTAASREANGVAGAPKLELRTCAR